METIIGHDITLAKHFLEHNELVGIPTETVYGLAGNALNPLAVVKIFEAKNRPFFNPLIIHIANIYEIQNYAVADELSMHLAKIFMPGPFTLLLPKKDNVPDIVTAGSTKVAIRVPDSSITQALLKTIDFPLAAPSANLFGYVSPVTAEHVFEGMKGKIPYILDGGKCNVGLESTIVEVEEDAIFIHRVGGISIEEIKLQAKVPLQMAAHQHKPITSGQLKSHYATSTALILTSDVDIVINQNKNKKLAIISLNTDFSGVSEKDQYHLSKKGSLNEAASNLFATMRILDTKNYDLIIAEKFPEAGLGLAINDRLQRAQFIHKEDLA